MLERLGGWFVLLGLDELAIYVWSLKELGLDYLV
jgi:hypothetical protein